ncbi:MAG: LamG domain-containing protein, partial [Chitinophagales bacterium]
APFWVKFTLHNNGGTGVAIVKLHVNDSLLIQKNCFIQNRGTLQDSLLCRLYAYGRNKLQIEGMPSREVTVVRPEHPALVAPEITRLQVSPVTRRGNKIYANYTVKNKGGNKQKFIIPVMLNGSPVFRDTVVLNAGDSCKIQHFISASLKEGLYPLQVKNNIAKTKIYTTAADAVVLDIPEEIHFAENAKDISGFGNNGYKAEEGDYISLPHTASLDSNGTTLTMMAWINDPGDKRKLTDLMAKGDNHVLQLKGTSELSFFAGGWGRGDCSVALPNDWRNNWHHIAGVCNGTDLRVYIDGALKGITPLEEVINLDVAAAWSIGGNEEFPLNRSFDGKIKGVKIFTAALDEAGIKDIYQKEKSAIAGVH